MRAKDLNFLMEWLILNPSQLGAGVPFAIAVSSRWDLMRRLWIFLSPDEGFKNISKRCEMTHSSATPAQIAVWPRKFKSRPKNSSQDLQELLGLSEMSPWERNRTVSTACLQEFIHFRGRWCAYLSHASVDIVPEWAMKVNSCFQSCSFTSSKSSLRCFNG